MLSEITKNKPEDVQNEDSGVAQLAKKIKKLSSKNVSLVSPKIELVAKRCKKMAQFVAAWIFPAYFFLGFQGDQINYKTDERN